MLLTLETSEASRVILGFSGKRAHCCGSFCWNMKAKLSLLSHRHNYEFQMDSSHCQLRSGGLRQSCSKASTFVPYIPKQPLMPSP